MDSTVIEVRVRYAETDQMGRAHHAHHLVWCESARTAWLRERGMAYTELEARDVLLPVSRASVDYRRPARYDDTVQVEAWPETVRSRSVTFRYALRRPGSGELLAEAETDLVCVDEEERIRRIPDDLRTLLEEGAVGA